MTITLQNNHKAGRRVLNSASKHALAWILFIGYELTSVYIATGRLGGIGGYALFYSLNIGLFYFHALFVLPHAFNSSRPRYLAGSLLLLSGAAVYMALKYAADHYIEGFRLPPGDRHLAMRYMFINLWRGVYFIGLATAFWIFKRMMSLRGAMIEADRKQLLMAAEKAEVEKRLAEVNYAFLQHQVNPHFLFNALNLVYSQVAKLSSVASSCLLKLTSVLRYSFEMKNPAAKADLFDEIRHIHDLVGINRLRYDHELFLDIEEQLVPGNYEIIPLILLTLTENVFKHGYLKDKNHPAKILISVDEKRLLKFATWNLRKRRPGHNTTTAVGLMNAIKRLHYMYGPDYNLDVLDAEEHFGITLTIQL